MTLDNNVTPNEYTTSTEYLAREIHLSSWKHNEGRTVYDIPLFDTLHEVQRIHLLDTAHAGEVMMEKYRDEDPRLLNWNLALVLWDAYHQHPYSDLPSLSYQAAPLEVRQLWQKYAKDFEDLWWQVKDLPKLVTGNTEIKFAEAT